MRGLLPLKDATALSNAYHALAELDRKRQQGMELSEDEKERHDPLQTIVPRLAQSIVLPVGHHYTFDDYCRDELRFYELSRQDRSARDGGDPLTPGDEIELAFLTAHRLFY